LADLGLNASKALLLCLLLTSLVLAFPSVHAAQTTRIYELVHPIRAVAGSLDPIPVTAIVFYNNTVPGYSLVVGILDAEKTPQTIIPGTATSSSGPCVNQPVLAALCVISLPSASGAERLDFKIGGILGGKREPGAWNLNITAALFDANSTRVPKSTSSILFGIELTPARLKVTVPSAVAVSVDGVQQPPGPAEVGVAVGQHNITLPSLVQVDPTTRLRFAHWADGLTETNRTVVITSDTNLEAVYVTQNLLTITGPELTSVGAGWYDETATATFSIAPMVPMNGLLGILGGKLSFQGWYENGKFLTGSTIGTISMNQPHMITAVWQADYSLPAAILAGIVIILAFAYLMVRRRTAKGTRRRPYRRRKRT
jgi:hypothetical protein